jgi:hypothetical protein
MGFFRCAYYNSSLPSTNNQYCSLRYVHNMEMLLPTHPVAFFKILHDVVRDLLACWLGGTPVAELAVRTPKCKNGHKDVAIRGWRGGCDVFEYKYVLVANDVAAVQKNRSNAFSSWITVF